MKIGSSIFNFNLLLGFVLLSCTGADKSAPNDGQTKDTTLISPVKDSTLALEAATETFKGTYQGKELIFSHKDFQTYTLKTGEQVSYGKLITERGYGDDKSAKVYILNSDKPKNEQKSFVRNTNGSVYMLDQDGFVVDDAVFDHVKTAAKPIVEKTEPVQKTLNGAKKQKSVTTKKTRTKKAVKSKRKKKKSTRKTRKKSRTRKTTPA